MLEEMVVMEEYVKSLILERDVLIILIVILEDVFKDNDIELMNKRRFEREVKGL